jgi:hypothetical protein
MQDVMAEFDTLLMPDKRLAQRLRLFIDQARSNPSVSLPQMMQDAAQLEGAYRLINNRRVTPEAILAPHTRSTCERAEALDVVVLHDATEIETQYADAEEVGHLKTGKAGYRAHLSVAVGVQPGQAPRPLGVVSLEADFRGSAPEYNRVKKSKSGWQTARCTDKAYLRWERGIEASSKALSGSTSVIHVADREADSYPLFHKVLELGDGLVVRVRCDRRARAVTDEEDLFADDWTSLSEIAFDMEGSFERTVPLSKRGDKAAPASKKRHPPREARGAQLHYSAKQVELRRPHYQPAALPESLHLWMVRVWEPTPPAGEKAVEWMLLTTEPCKTPAEIMRVVDLYRSRWLIEDFFKVLKTICKLEERQFESRHALLNILAVFLPIAVHLLWVRACARDSPEVPATEVFSPLQLEVLTRLSPRKMPDHPTAMQAIWVLAGFGGHIANNGWPGPQVLARAFIRLVEAVATWQAALKSRSEM